jgi:hypothetical protein
MEIGDKRGEIVQRYESLGGEVVNLDMDMDKEGATLRKDQNSWKREAHK